MPVSLPRPCPVDHQLFWKRFAPQGKLTKLPLAVLGPRLLICTGGAPAKKASKGASQHAKVRRTNNKKGNKDASQFAKVCSVDQLFRRGAAPATKPNQSACQGFVCWASAVLKVHVFRKQNRRRYQSACQHPAQ